MVFDMVLFILLFCFAKESCRIFVVYDKYYTVNKPEMLVCLQLAKNCEPKRQSEKKLEILKGRVL